jgi:hypothetical protein
METGNVCNIRNVEQQVVTSYEKIGAFPLVKMQLRRRLVLVLRTLILQSNCTVSVCAL